MVETTDGREEILSLAFVCVSVYAQRDIKTIEGMSSSQIRSIMGTPKSTDLGESFSDVGIYEYDDTRFGIMRNNRRNLDFFVTKSSKYCVLSGLIPGGIRVGDDIPKLKDFYFANCAYGRNKASNALKSNQKVVHDLIGYSSNHVIFEDEYHSIHITIEDNKVVAWGFSSKADTPYEPYDGSIKLW